MKQKTLDLQIQTDLELITRDVPCQRVIEISVRAPETDRVKDRPPLNLALVIDRSGSMRGDKLRYVKEAVKHVLNQLKPMDRVAVIAYDDTISVLSKSESVTAAHRNHLMTQLDMMQPGNMTNLGGGWLKGCEEIADSQEEGLVNQALLLTDGLANVGITGLEELGYHANQIHSRGVSTSTFGVGLNFNEHLLEHMANQGGGNFYFIEHPESIPQIFINEFEELSAITARDTELVVELPQQVSATLLGSWKHERDGDTLKIALGDIASGQTRELFLKLLTPPGKDTISMTMSATVKAKGEIGELMQTTSKLTLRYADQSLVDLTKPDAALLERYSIVQVADAASHSLKLEREGKYEEAGHLLQEAIMESAPYMPAPKVEEYHFMASQIRKGKMDERSRKKSHTKSYIDKRRRDKNNR